MITIGKRRFAKDQKEAVYAVLKAGGTADGLYHVKDRGITFYLLDGTPFAFLVANEGQNQFFVSVGKTADGRVFYSRSTTLADEERLGLEGLGYGKRQDLAAEIWEANKKA
jgi:hypothetical protein